MSTLRAYIGGALHNANILEMLQYRTAVYRELANSGQVVSIFDPLYNYLNKASGHTMFEADKAAIRSSNLVILNLLHKPTQGQSLSFGTTWELGYCEAIKEAGKSVLGAEAKPEFFTVMVLCDARLASHPMVAYTASFIYNDLQALEKGLLRYVSKWAEHH